jgi:hypothetical protein
MESVFRIVDECCTMNCAHRSSSTGRVFVGREIIKEAFASCAATFPDFVYLLKDAKLVRRADGARILAVKTYFTGTRTDARMSLADELFHDDYEKEVPHELFDESKMSADEIAQAKEITMRARREGGPYRVFGKVLYHFALNRLNKIIEFFTAVTVHGLTGIDPQQDPQQTSESAGDLQGTERNEEDGAEAVEVEEAEEVEEEMLSKEVEMSNRQSGLSRG